jgi:hypothetical protein
MIISGSVVALGFNSGIMQVKSALADNPTGWAFRTTYL